MHIPKYSQIVNPLYLVTHKKPLSIETLNSNAPFFVRIKQKKSLIQ